MIIWHIAIRGLEHGTKGFDTKKLILIKQ